VLRAATARPQQRERALLRTGHGAGALHRNATRDLFPHITDRSGFCPPPT